MGFYPVETVEQGSHIFLICLLSRREPRFIHPVIDIIIRPLIRLLNLLLQILREQVDRAILLINDIIELGVEHSDDLGGLVGDDGVLFFVPEGGDGEATGVVFVCGKVEVAEVGEVWVEGVWGGVFAWDGFVGGDEAPACWRGWVSMCSCVVVVE